MRVWTWVWAWVLLAVPASFMAVPGQDEEEQPGGREILEAIYRVSQVLETHERHTILYERVALLEESLSQKTENEVLLQAEVLQLRAKIPELEAEIETIPKMRKELAEFEAKIEKLVHDYEAKLSALASEVIRLKKYGARRKDLQTLSDGSNVQLRQAPSCPEVGQGMVALLVGEQCLYFSLGMKLNWTATHHHCQELGGDMAAPQNLLPLKAFLHQAFTRGPSLWLGASYDLGDDDIPGDESGEVKVSGESSETNSSLASSPDLPITLRDDSLGASPVRGPGPAPDHPFAMLLAEGHPGEGEAGMLGPAGSLRGALNQVAMFGENLEGYGSHSLPVLRAPEGDSPADMNERLSDASVVDIVLLKPSSPDHHHHLQVEPREDERSLSNQTTGDVSSAALTAAVSEDRDAPRNRGAVEETGTSETQESGKVEARKARMQCMLLQQRESLDYELVSRPCNELHNFVCDLKVTIDLLHE